DVWDHWYHVELHASGPVDSALVHLWTEAGSVELASNPTEGCAAALAAIDPLLAALASQGLRVVDPDKLMAEYEVQRARVLRVADMVGGRAEAGAAQDRGGA